MAQACSACVFLPRSFREFLLPFIWEETTWLVALVLLRLNRFIRNIIGHSGFCSCPGHLSCNAMFNASLRANSEPAACHSKFMSVTMYKHLRRVSVFVSILTYSLEASPSCVRLEELLAINAFDPAKLRTREAENGDVNLVSRSHEADDAVWVGHEKALDRTTSATGKILLDPHVQKSNAEHRWPVQERTMWPMRCLF